MNMPRAIGRSNALATLLKSAPGPGSIAKVRRGVYGADVLAHLVVRFDSCYTTARRLTEMLAVRRCGLSYPSDAN